MNIKEKAIEAYNNLLQEGAKQAKEYAVKAKEKAKKEFGEDWIENGNLITIGDYKFIWKGVKLCNINADNINIDPSILAFGALAQDMDAEEWNEL